MKRKTWAAIAAASLGALGLAAWLWAPPQMVKAADHTDPPRLMGGGAAADAADIADLYVFAAESGNESTVFVLTYAGPATPEAGQSATYDRDVVYGIHIDTNDDNDSTDAVDHTIWVRFGSNSSGNWGMEVTGMPGQTDAVMGPAEFQNQLGTDGDAGTFWAGLREDPFFFDLSGFGATLTSATTSPDEANLMFDPTNDDFAGANVSAIVISVPNSVLLTGGDTDFQAWATTRRITGS